MVGTPSTPRIDISCASSSSLISDKSNSDDIQLASLLGLGFQDGAEDLRSSTEEIDASLERFEQLPKVKLKPYGILSCFRRSSCPNNPSANNLNSKSEEVDARRLSCQSLLPDAWACMNTFSTEFSYGSAASAYPKSRSHSLFSSKSNGEESGFFSLFNSSNNIRQIFHTNRLVRTNAR